MEATSGGGIGVRCAQAASILTSINEKLQAAHVADVDKGTLIADVAMLKAFGCSSSAPASRRRAQSRSARTP
jgi:hypothetical protein